MKKVFTVGVFDLLHVGHVELFRRAKSLGDWLVVAVQDSEEVTRYKPDTTPVFSTEERMYMVKSIRYVDAVVCYHDVDQIIKEVDFDVFVAGPDQVHDGFQRAMEWCSKNGKDVVVLPRTEKISSTHIKDLIKGNDGHE